MDDMNRFEPGPLVILNPLNEIQKDIMNPDEEVQEFFAPDIHTRRVIALGAPEYNDVPNEYVPWPWRAGSWEPPECCPICGRFLNFYRWGGDDEKKYYEAYCPESRLRRWFLRIITLNVDYPFYSIAKHGHFRMVLDGPKTWS